MRLGKAGDSLTSLVPVAVASTLIAFCLAGAPLYSSSSGSASLDDQLAETCRTDSALVLGIPADESASRSDDPDVVEGVVDESEARCRTSNRLDGCRGCVRSESPSRRCRND